MSLLNTFLSVRGATHVKSINLDVGVHEYLQANKNAISLWVQAEFTNSYSGEYLYTSIYSFSVGDLEYLDETRFAMLREVLTLDIKDNVGGCRVESYDVPEYRTESGLFREAFYVRKFKIAYVLSALKYDRGRRDVHCGPRDDFHDYADVHIAIVDNAVLLRPVVKCRNW